MIARVATVERLDPSGLSGANVELLRQTVRSAPGFRAGYHLRNTETGKALSISIFESREAGEGARDALAQRPSDKRVNIEPDAVEFYEVIEF